MNTNEYSKLALRTEADQLKILDRLYVLGPNTMRLDNAVRGLTDEVGEINAIVKKHIEYQQDLDKTNLKEEVGDCLWRLNQICFAAGFSLEECMEANIRKLQIRYPEKYSDELAKDRDLEGEKKQIIGYMSPTITLSK